MEETSIESSEGGEHNKDLEDEETLPSEEGKQQLQGKESKSGGQLTLKAHAFYENRLADRMGGRSSNGRCKLEVWFYNYIQHSRDLENSLRVGIRGS